MRRSAALVVALAACSAPEAEEAGPCGGPGVICALAGDGRAAFNGDGKPAAETSFYLPSAVRVGPDGLAYVMDFNNMRLRRVGDDGRVETVVGNGIHAFAQVGLAPTETPLENPIDFAFDADGSIVIVALHDPRVLRVTDGAIEVVAGTGVRESSGDGGPAEEASFTEITAMALAPDGTVYVSDGGGHRVRAVRGGIVEAVAGTGERGYGGDGGPAVEATLTEPHGLALDADGNLFIADYGSHTIRRVDPSGTITTVAGTGTKGSSGDDGPASEAELSFPWGVATGPDGALYLSDSQNHRIRRVDSSGTITTVAGTSAGLSGDGGPAASAMLRAPAGIAVSDGMLYIADMQNHVVRVVHLEEP